jgi:hypothetical protein
LAGTGLLAQVGTGGAAVINVVALDAAHAVFAPLAFLGAMYQVYVVAAVKPVAL